LKGLGSGGDTTEGLEDGTRGGKIDAASRESVLNVQPSLSLVHRFWCTL